MCQPSRGVCVSACAPGVCCGLLQMFVEDMDIEGADVEHSVSLAAVLLCCLQPVG